MLFAQFNNIIKLVNILYYISKKKEGIDTSKGGGGRSLLYFPTLFVNSLGVQVIHTQVFFYDKNIISFITLIYRVNSDEKRQTGSNS